MRAFGEVLLAVLAQVGILVGREHTLDRLGHIGLLRLGERVARLPEREAEDVTVEDVVRGVGGLGREAGLP